MALEKLEKDLAHVSKLDDEPNDVGGMTAEELKAVFDKAPQEIQDYINEVLIPGIESMAVPGTGDFKANGSVTATGNFHMGGNRIAGLGTPQTDTDAATKGYADTCAADAVKNAVTNKAGQAQGFATLDEDGKLPDAQLPTYTKEETLSDDTKAIYELGETAGPDNVFFEIKSALNANANKIEAVEEAAAKIKTGSYIGTGTYGESNPCSLTFDFAPKAMWLMYGGGSTASAYLVLGASYQYNGRGYAKVSGNTVYWYGSGNAANQMNDSGIQYNYLVLG